jgi:hypothetical protein
MVDFICPVCKKPDTAEHGFCAMQNEGCSNEVKIACEACRMHIKGRIYFTCSQECSEGGVELVKSHMYYTNIFEAYNIVYIIKDSEGLLEDMEFLYENLSEV